MRSASDCLFPGFVQRHLFALPDHHVVDRIEVLPQVLPGSSSFGGWLGALKPSYPITIQRLRLHQDLG